MTEALSRSRQRLASSEGTCSCASFARSMPVPRLLVMPESKSARGEYLAFTDDDCMADGEWLNAFDRRFQAQPKVCVGGPVANGLEGNSYSIASQLVSEHVREFFSETNSPLLFFTTNNIAFPAAALRQIGGFFERYRLVASEDREICYRWTSLGRQSRLGTTRASNPRSRSGAAPVLDPALHLWTGRLSFLSGKAGLGRFLAPSAAGILFRFVEKTAAAIYRRLWIAPRCPPGAVPNGDSVRIPARTAFLPAADQRRNFSVIC